MSAKIMSFPYMPAVPEDVPDNLEDMLEFLNGVQKANNIAPSIDASKSDMVEIDTTPNEELPQRILKAFIENRPYTDNNMGLPISDPKVQAAEKSRMARNKILTQAIMKLDGTYFRRGGNLDDPNGVEKE